MSMERICRTTTMTRKPKWQYPQAVPSTPRNLYLPRINGVRRNSQRTKTPLSSQKDRKQRLEVLFEQERTFDLRGFTPAIVVLNEEVEERRSGGGSPDEADADEAKWRFQAEMLRAECNLLRIEKEITVKKMERRRERMETTLRSTVDSLVFGKQKISEGKNVTKILEQEISHLVDKLRELSKPIKVKDTEGKACRQNFDREASVLRRRLEEFDEVSDEMCVKAIREMAEASFSVPPSSSGYHDFAPNSNYNKTKTGKGRKECSRHCKAIVRRIVEDVRAEAEQWSQMQDMLRNVRDEMEELQDSRDFWRDCALDSDFQIQNVREWRKRVLSSEARVKTLQKAVRSLSGELERIKKNHYKEAEISSLPSETEKKVLICHLNENHHTNKEDHQSKYEEILRRGRRKTRTVHSRVPLGEIRNSSIATRSLGCRDNDIRY